MGLLKMQMRVLQIDDDTRKEIKKVKAFAYRHKVDEANLRATMAGIVEPIGDDPDYVVHIHDGYRVVYSVEEQSIGDCHHISVSVDKKGRAPHPLAVEMILEEFGMKKLEDSLAVWPEGIAINIVQEIE